jgi:hypothetical protein
MWAQASYGRGTDKQAASTLITTVCLSAGQLCEHRRFEHQRMCVVCDHRT